MNQQRAVSLRVIEQSQTLQQQVLKFAEQAQSIRAAVEASYRGQALIESLTNRLEQLEKLLHEPAPPPAAVPGRP